MVVVNKMGKSLTIAYPHGRCFMSIFSVPSADLPLCCCSPSCCRVLFEFSLRASLCPSCETPSTNSSKEQSFSPSKTGVGSVSTTIHGVVTLGAQKLDAIISKYDIVFFGSRAM